MVFVNILIKLKYHSLALVRTTHTVGARLRLGFCCVAGGVWVELVSVWWMRGEGRWVGGWVFGWVCKVVEKICSGHTEHSNYLTRSSAVDRVYR